MLKNILILIISAIAIVGHSQNVIPTSYPVLFEGKNLESPFVGGLNVPQIYTIDLNNDGLLDAVIMDRDGGVIIPYLRTETGTGTNLEYAPSYKSSFPNVQEWFKIRDFNNDGISDLFCYPKVTTPAIEARKGKYENGKIVFETIPFNEISQFPNIIPIPASNGYTNLYVGSNDQPEIIDIDMDGDMDILTFDGGGSYLQYYKNYAIENGLSLDTFSMRLEESCWGKFFEKETSQEVILSDDPETCATAFSGGPVVDERHAGSCVTLFDEDGNGTFDVILGDLSNDKISLLRNTGDNESGFITEQDNTFPSYDVPISMDIFNATFYIDINNDGLRDLLAAPNAKANIENYKVLWYYKNVGTDDNPTFEYRKDDFLVEDMIDLGASSSPTFTDYNQDGLVDIIVGSRGLYQGQGETDPRIYLFENVGTPTAPSFELVDDDYNNFSQFGASGFLFFPTFGDLDGDGDNDMLVGDQNGYLYYAENIAGPGLPYEYAPTITEFMGIRPGNSVRVSIADLNQDGLGDIIIGERQNNSNGMGGVGALIYFPNIGSIGNPLFEDEETDDPNILAFGRVNTKTPFDAVAMSAPYLYYDNQEYKLFVGSRGGKIDVYNNIEGNLEGAFDTLYYDFGNIRDGASTSLAVADIDGDNLLEMVVGNERGGLTMYQTEILADANVNTENIKTDIAVNLFPNPSRAFISFDTELDLKDAFYKVYNIDGKLMLENQFTGDTKVDIREIPQGTYLIELNYEDEIITRKFVKI